MQWERIFSQKVESILYKLSIGNLSLTMGGKILGIGLRESDRC